MTVNNPFFHALKLCGAVDRSRAANGVVVLMMGRRCWCTLLVLWSQATFKKTCGVLVVGRAKHEYLY